jgi:hypothetical protein
MEIGHCIEGHVLFRLLVGFNYVAFYSEFGAFHDVPCVFVVSRIRVLSRRCAKRNQLNRFLFQIRFELLLPLQD